MSFTFKLTVQELDPRLKEAVRDLEALAAERGLGARIPITESVGVETVAFEDLFFSLAQILTDMQKELRK